MDYILRAVLPYCKTYNKTHYSKVQTPLLSLSHVPIKYILLEFWFYQKESVSHYRTDGFLAF